MSAERATEVGAANSGAANSGAASTMHPEKGPAVGTIVGESGLPAEVQALLREVIRRAGGWRSERADLARELVDHFRDAIAAGSTPAAAIRDFGDPRRAARLMRRAMRRRRGFAWHAWWVFTRVLLLVVLAGIATYGVLAARYFLGRPVVSVDYRDRLAALVDTGVPEERAWPLLRDAVARLRSAEKEFARTIAPRPGVEPDPPPRTVRRPEDPAWNAAVEITTREADAIATLRAAAARRVVGLAPVGPGDEDRRILGLDPAAPEPNEAWSSSLLGILLPHVAALREAHSWLAVDASIAAHAGDGPRAAGDLVALLGVARQLHGPFLIEQVSAQKAAAAGATMIVDLLAAHPDLFDEGSLARLALAVDSIPDRLTRLEFAGERMVIADTIQRLYSDDGHGNGRLVHAGARMAAALEGTKSVGRDDLERLLEPALAATYPTRREILDRFDAEVLRYEDLQRRPPWTWSAEDFGIGLVEAPRPALAELLPVSRAFLAPPPVTIIRGSADLALALAEARVAIALARFERAAGRAPQSLDELVPRFLDRVPLDPYDGAPLRCAARDGSLHVWSVGPDRIDDGLRMKVPARPPGRTHGWMPPESALARAKDPVAAIRELRPRGDLELWPRVPEPAGAPAPTGPPVLIRSP